MGKTPVWFRLPYLSAFIKLLYVLLLFPCDQDQWGMSHVKQAIISFSFAFFKIAFYQFVCLVYVCSCSLAYLYTEIIYINGLCKALSAFLFFLFMQCVSIILFLFSVISPSSSIIYSQCQISFLNSFSTGEKLSRTNGPLKSMKSLTHNSDLKTMPFTISKCDLFVLFQ